MTPVAPGVYDAVGIGIGPFDLSSAALLGKLGHAGRPTIAAVPDQPRHQGIFDHRHIPTLRSEILAAAALAGA